MFRIHRLLIAYAIGIPLALVLGYMVATPDMASIAVLGMVAFVLVLPLLLQWNHWLLILSWNSVFIAGFLPGQMQLWVIFSMLTFGMAVIHRFMGHRNFLRAPELTKPILFLTAIVLLTGRIRGGLGVRILGSGSYGGKNYFYVLAAVIGYFGLTSQPIFFAKRERASRWFFLVGASNLFGNLIYMIGPAAYFLYLLIPYGAVQVNSEWSDSVVNRIGGFGPAGTFVLCYALARWGIQGIVDWTKPWRMLLVIAALVGAMFSGFRTELVFPLFLIFLQFLFEGLWKTPLFPALILLGLMALGPMLLFANKLPGSMQRTLAFLPVNINADIRVDAESSVAWRKDMWREVWPEVPKYLLIGKGYAINPEDLYLTIQGAEAGALNSFEGSMLANDFHSGPLSILIPFGLFGSLAFIWVLVAGTRVLWWNYRYGETRLRRPNVTLLAYFVGQSIFFFFAIGAFNVQLPMFLGVLGFSVSLNGGVCRRPVLARSTSVSSALAAPVALA